MAVSPSSKMIRISDDLELTHRLPDDNSAEVKTDGPFTYLIALRCVLFTMALAGSYRVAGWSERGPN